MSATPTLSIVTTLYRSSSTIEEFVSRATATAREFAGDRYEIIIVNDGSPDDSADKVRQLQRRFENIVLVDLSRNFGHHVALLEGLGHSHGDVVFLIDSDLEEEPEWLDGFVEQLEAQLADVVYGYQEQRKGGWFERWSGAIYWWLFLRLSGLELPPNIVTARLMTRRYVDAVALYDEREISMGGIFRIAGFEQVGRPVAKAYKGESTYSLRLKLWHLVSSIVSFSTRPLTFIFAMGVGVSLVGLVLVIYLVVAGMFWSQSPAGWRTVVASVWLLGGLILSSLGVIAIYLGKVFTEVKARPRAIVRSIEDGSATNSQL